MASITSEPNGRRTIQFVGADGRRRSIRLGKVPDRKLPTIKERIEDLVTASVTGQTPHDDTVRWVAKLDARLRDKLERVGLVAPREPKPIITLEAFIDGYVQSRCDVKGSTATVYGHTRRNLIEHFGPGKALDAITEGDADEWRLGLIRQGLADNTVRRRCGIAKQFFRVAVRKGLIASNPFRDLKSAVRGNRSRSFHVTREHARRIIDACPDAQWRLLFALSRYGGLRCPSEHLGLRWQDVDWERGRLTIHSPKTEHHEGGESRLLPIFPELLPYLREVFEEAEPGTEHIITRYRDRNQNLRTQLQRIIRRAGLEPWPKLFHNLRATRETELAERWPLHVVCAWIGNSRAVAAEHYLQVTDEHFEQAAAARTGSDNVGEDRALQNPVQYGTAPGRMDSPPEYVTVGETRDFDAMRADAAACGEPNRNRMGGTGLEPVTSWV